MIEIANASDIEQLNVLINSAYRGEYSKKGWTTEADLLGGIRTNEESLQRMMSRDESTFLKFIESGKITGCVHLQIENERVYLGLLTVNPELQGRGIGKKLLAASEKFASDNLCTSVYMSVISKRKELVDWYVRHGYEFTGETQPFPEGDKRFGIPKMKLEFVLLEKKIG